MRCRSYVRFNPNSGHSEPSAACPLCVRSGHWWSQFPRLGLAPLFVRANSRSARLFLAWHKHRELGRRSLLCVGRAGLLVVGEIKRWLRNDAGSIDLGADTAFLVRP